MFHYKKNMDIVIVFLVIWLLYANLMHTKKSLKTDNMAATLDSINHQKKDQEKWFLFVFSFYTTSTTPDWWTLTFKPFRPEVMMSFHGFVYDSELS